MTTRELIQAEIDTFSEDRLDELYLLIKQFVQSKQPAKKPTFMSKLQQIQIDAPVDFSSNFDKYAIGENRAKTDIH
ncbi:conserved hypothetical protein [Beggiatoa sp. PS]|nr:conserved hypothetical protein [Beggiatoa sp. PS]